MNWGEGRGEKGEKKLITDKYLSKINYTYLTTSCMSAFCMSAFLN
ncbi:hypothetical protein N44_03897 [Microcystis aeruginosa NIES-44]|uniref:Uncharacterized protein n=1 Tax=Microcystis aeruginosa NIES-44 TaxID=449439 RepID=A0A0A1VZ11_MICAE|nr:hypothetical protein N44_03897 [Microcystis aeruginosa NIES-44]